jgi:hypothetical protein
MFYVNNRERQSAALLVAATKAAPRLVFMEVSAKMVGYAMHAVGPGSAPVWTPFAGLTRYPSPVEK